MATRTISKAGGKSSETSAWVEGAVPTSADDIVATAESGNLTVDAALSCRSFDLTNYVGTLKREAAIKIGTSTAIESAIALKLPTSGWVLEQTNSGTAFEFLSSAATELTVDFGGKTQEAGITFNGTGKWKLTRGLTVAASKTLTLTKGTLDLAGQTLSTGKLASSNTNTRTLKTGAAAISLTGTGSVWDMTTTTGLTIEAAGSTISITDTGATEKKFIGGGQTFGNLTVKTGTGTVVIGATASNTFATFKVEGATALKLQFGAEKTQTFTAWEVKGSAGNLITIESTESGKPHTISIA